MIRPLLIALLLATTAAARGDLREDMALSEKLGAATPRRTEHLSIRVAPGSVGKLDMWRFARLAEHGALAISKLTGVPLPPRIDIYIAPDVGVSHTFPHFPAGDHAPRMFIDATRVSEERAPYLHELVHAIVGDGGAVWLEEGYASWIASSVASKGDGYYAPVLSAANDGVDAQASKIVHRLRPDELEKELSWMRGSTEPDFDPGRERKWFYVLSHSFTKYLGEKIGVKELTAIHRRNDIEELARRTGKTSAQWRSEWIASLP